MKEAAPIRRICARPGCGHDVTNHTLMLEGHCTGTRDPRPPSVGGEALAACDCVAFVFGERGSSLLV